MKKHISLENLIYSIIFLLPIYLIRFSFGLVKTNMLELLIGVAIFWWLIAFYQKEKIIKIWNEYRRYILSAAVMLLGVLFSAFFNNHLLQSLGIVKGWFLFPMVFALIAADIIQKGKVVNFFRVYEFSTFAVAVCALGYYFSGQMTYDHRLQAFFNSPNYLAMYLAPGIIIGFWSILNYRKKMLNNYGWQYMLLAIMLGALFLTRSYASIGAIALAVCLIFWVGLGFKKSQKLLAAVLFVVAVGIFFYLSQGHTQKFNDLATLDSRSSLASRLMIWQAAGRMIKNNPIIGIGPANFQEKYLNYQQFYPPYLEWAVPHPQNLYLDFWLSGGILGIGGFMSLIFFIIIDLCKNKKQSALNILALGLLVYILSHGLFDTAYFKNDLAVVFWLIFLALKEID